MNEQFAKAFILAQGEIGRAVKDSNNPHFKAKFASLAAVQSACMEALHKHGFSVLQPTTVLENGTAALKTILLHSSGECLESVYPLNPVKGDPQGYGSALTYARRYCLASLVGVVQDDDDGNNGSKRPPAPQAPEASKLDALKGALAKAHDRDRVNDLAVAWEHRVSEGEVNVVDAEAGRNAIKKKLTELKAQK
jgi:hypothetical protein